MDIVQPLLDMAAGSLVHAPSPQEDLQAQPQVPSSSIAAVHTPVSSSSIAEALPQVSSASIAAALPQLPPQLQNPEALAAVAQLFQSGQGHEVRAIIEWKYASQYQVSHDECTHRDPVFCFLLIWVYLSNCHGQWFYSSYTHSKYFVIVTLLHTTSSYTPEQHDCDRNSPLLFLDQSIWLFTVN